MNSWFLISIVDIVIVSIDGIAIVFNGAIAVVPAVFSVVHLQETILYSVGKGEVTRDETIRFDPISE